MANADKKMPKKKEQHATATALWASASTTAAGKGEAVALAVADQLQLERHWPPEDFNKVMAADYGYDLPSLANFLAAVHSKLEPNYNFQFDVNFIKSSLSKSVSELTGAIYAKTN